MEKEIAGVFLDYSCGRIEALTKDLQTCLGKLSEEQVWERHGEHENAVANLVLHLCGNARQWVMHGVGGVTDVRVRELEFSTRGGMDRAELEALFVDTMAEAQSVIGATRAEKLLEVTHPQGRTVTGLEAIYQVVTHIGQHVGQIVLLTKQMTGRDLDLTMPRPR